MSSKSGKTSSRPYRKRARAEQEAATRLRITEAAVKLHGTLGPARTSFAALAREAGVERATVYRHFADEAALFEACSAHWQAHNQPPDLAAWAAIDDPRKRLRTALTEMYAWFERGEYMLSRLLRDAPVVPAMAQPMQRMAELQEAMAGVLMAGWGVRGARRRRTRAAVGHALGFGTWHSLRRQQGLESADAVDLAASLVEVAAREPAQARRTSTTRRAKEPGFSA